MNRLQKKLERDPHYNLLPDDEAKARYIGNSPELLRLALLDARDGLPPYNRGARPGLFDPETRRLYLVRGECAEWRVRTFEDQPIDAERNPQSPIGVVYFRRAHPPESGKVKRKKLTMRQNYVRSCAHWLAQFYPRPSQYQHGLYIAKAVMHNARGKPERQAYLDRLNASFASGRRAGLNRLYADIARLTADLIRIDAIAKANRLTYPI